MTLIYLHIFNPSTPGNNKKQEIEYFYTYVFEEGDDPGPPGLDLNEVNINGISSLLNQGFNGTEIVYYKHGRAVKSKLTTSYYPTSPQTSTTYYFNTKPFLKRLYNKLIGQNTKYEDIKIINLKDIFSGLSGS